MKSATKRKINTLPIREETGERYVVIEVRGRVMLREIILHGGDRRTVLWIDNGAAVLAVMTFGDIHEKEPQRFGHDYLRGDIYNVLDDRVTAKDVQSARIPLELKMGVVIEHADQVTSVLIPVGQFMAEVHSWILRDPELKLTVDHVDPFVRGDLFEAFKDLKESLV